MEESNVILKNTAKNYEFQEQEIKKLKKSLYRNNGHREKC